MTEELAWFTRCSGRELLSLLLQTWPTAVRRSGGELLLFVDHHRSSEIIVLHDVAAEARTRLRYDRGVRLIQTSQR